MQRNSTAYIVFFASMVTLVAGVTLAVTATMLKPRQEVNMALEKKSFILAAVGYDTEGKSTEQIETDYEKYIEEKVIDLQGNEIEGEDAFDIDHRVQDRILAKDPSANVNLPLYIYSDGSEVAYIIPLVGQGLWGPIWGYLALDEDYRNVKGAIFDHKSETPGLGAEITGRVFRESFINKKVFDENRELTGVVVLKGTGNRTTENQVDGISGSTFTGNGVTNMIKKDLKRYQPYFTNKK